MGRGSGGRAGAGGVAISAGGLDVFVDPCVAFLCAVEEAAALLLFLWLFGADVYDVVVAFTLAESEGAEPAATRLTEQDEGTRGDHDE